MFRERIVFNLNSFVLFIRKVSINALLRFLQEKFENNSLKHKENHPVAWFTNLHSDINFKYANVYLYKLMSFIIFCLKPYMLT